MIVKKLKYNKIIKIIIRPLISVITSNPYLGTTTTGILAAMASDGKHLTQTLQVKFKYIVLIYFATYFNYC